MGAGVVRCAQKGKPEHWEDQIGYNSNSTSESASKAARGEKWRDERMRMSKREVFLQSSDAKYANELAWYSRNLEAGVPIIISKDA